MGLSYILTAFIAIIVGVLIISAIFRWVFRVNEMIETLKDIRDKIDSSNN